MIRDVNDEPVIAEPNISRPTVPQVPAALPVLQYADPLTQSGVVMQTTEDGGLAVHLPGSWKRLLGLGGGAGALLLFGLLMGNALLLVVFLFAAAGAVVRRTSIIVAEGRLTLRHPWSPRRSWLLSEVGPIHRIPESLGIVIHIT